MGIAEPVLSPSAARRIDSAEGLNPSSISDCCDEFKFYSGHHRPRRRRADP